MNRAPIFDAIRRLLGRGLYGEEVRAVDAAITEAESGDAAITPRRIGPEGLALIKRFEGLRLNAYLCPADVPTIGYGSTGPHVRIGMTITEARAEELLREDLTRFEACVSAKCPNTTQQQFDAMVSLAFNVGCAGFEKSTVARMHNARWFGKAADAFALWNKGGGRVLPGLVKRRAAEADLYRKGSV